MPAHKRLTPDIIKRAVNLRLLGTMQTGRPPSWESIAATLGFTDRWFREVRKTPEWAQVLRDSGETMDTELLHEARLRLAHLIGSKDERVALQAARCILEYTIGTRIELLARHDHRIAVTAFDVSSLSTEALRQVAREVASAANIGPGRALPPASLDEEIVDAEVVECE
jgi:hypothetical protein